MIENQHTPNPRRGNWRGEIGENLIPPNPRRGNWMEEIGRKTVLWLIKNPAFLGKKDGVVHGKTSCDREINHSS